MFGCEAYLFFESYSIDADAHIHTLKLAPTNIRTQSYPISTFKRLGRQILRIDEVTADVSLSRGHVAYLPLKE